MLKFFLDTVFHRKWFYERSDNKKKFFEQHNHDLCPRTTVVSRNHQNAPE